MIRLHFYSYPFTYPLCFSSFTVKRFIYVLKKDIINLWVIKGNNKRNTCGPDAQPKTLPITRIFEIPMWAFLILQPSFPELSFHGCLWVFLKPLSYFYASERYVVGSTWFWTFMRISLVSFIANWKDNEFLYHFQLNSIKSNCSAVAN